MHGGALTHRPRVWWEEPKHRETKQHFDHGRLTERPKCIELLRRREEVKYRGRAHHRAKRDCGDEEEAEYRDQGGLEKSHPRVRHGDGAGVFLSARDDLIGV